MKDGRPDATMMNLPDVHQEHPATPSHTLPRIPKPCSNVYLSDLSFTKLGR
jgi:hypothetical protein